MRLCLHHLLTVSTLIAVSGCVTCSGWGLSAWTGFHHFKHPKKKPDLTSRAFFCRLFAQDLWLHTWCFYNHAVSGCCTLAQRRYVTTCSSPGWITGGAAPELQPERVTHPLTMQHREPGNGRALMVVPRSCSGANGW